MYLYEIYCKVRVGKCLSDTFFTQNGLKEEDTLSTLFSNLALEYAITKVQEKPGWTESE
jgi:hypothetical protein